MTVKIENNQLVITIPMEQPRPSATGKSLVVASTHGIQATGAQVNGKPVKVGVNAFIDAR